MNKICYRIGENNNQDTAEDESDKQLNDIYIFSGIMVATILVTLGRSFLFFIVSAATFHFLKNKIVYSLQLAMKASQSLHNSMYQGVARATMHFFNTNSSGRIINRFSKDMGQIDEILPVAMIDFIQTFLQLGAVIIIVSIVNYWFLIPTIIIGIIFYFLRNIYLKSSQSIKRLEATCKYTYNLSMSNKL